jgi:hypothetical protein
MLSNYGKAEQLYKAIKLLNEVNVLVQKTLGASDDTYKVHCKCEDLQATLADYCENLIEMQITE